MRWFRFYNETLHDPKVQRLPAELFRTWVNLLCIASENSGAIPTDAENLAFLLHMNPKAVTASVQKLKLAGLLDEDETLHPHNWNGRQYASDDVATRVKRHRQRQRNVSSNVTETADETPPEADTDTEADKKDLAGVGVTISRRWEMDEESKMFVALKCLQGSELEECTETFVNNHLASMDTKADWQAAFRSYAGGWARNRHKYRQNGAGKANAPPSFAAAAMAVLKRAEGGKS